MAQPESAAGGSPAGEWLCAARRERVLGGAVAVAIGSAMLLPSRPVSLAAQADA
jgi:hypothetical protein